MLILGLAHPLFSSFLRGLTRRLGFLHNEVLLIDAAEFPFLSTAPVLQL